MFCSIDSCWSHTLFMNGRDGVILNSLQPVEQKLRKTSIKVLLQTRHNLLINGQSCSTTSLPLTPQRSRTTSTVMSRGSFIILLSCTTLSQSSTRRFFNSNPMLRVAPAHTVPCHQIYPQAIHHRVQVAHRAASCLTPFESCGCNCKFALFQGFQLRGGSLLNCRPSASFSMQRSAQTHVSTSTPALNFVCRSFTDPVLRDLMLASKMTAS